MIVSRAVLAAVIAARARAAGAVGCKKSEPSPLATSSRCHRRVRAGAPRRRSRVASVVAESLPRCRVDGARLAIPGDDVVAGDAVTTADALLVGVVRRDGGRRLASVVRASLDLASVKVDRRRRDARRRSSAVAADAWRDAYSSRRMRGAQRDADAAPAIAPGAMTRVLEIARLDGAALVREGAIVQQADESLAYDVAWPSSGGNGAPLVAWDEDAPMAPGQILADRGVVKVQVIGAGKPRVASPDTSDAEAPRLLARRGGYWLAWLARRPEPGEDAGAALPKARASDVRIAGSSSSRSTRRARRRHRCVASRRRRGASRRSTSRRGARTAALASRSSSSSCRTRPRIAEGAGERIVRYAVDGQKDRIESARSPRRRRRTCARRSPTARRRWRARRAGSRSRTRRSTRISCRSAPSLGLAGAPTLEPVARRRPHRRLRTSAETSSTRSGRRGRRRGGRQLRRLVCR